MSFIKDKIELEIQEAELGAQKALGQFPPMLKWLIIFCILATVPAYFIAKNISEKIWLSRYQPGALTAKQSFTNPLGPKISDVSVTTLGQGIYSATVQISNQNLDLSAGQIPYVFNFYNAKRETLYSETGKIFLLPNQTKYVVVPRFATSEPVAFTDFKITSEITWQKKLSIPKVNVITSTPNTYNQFSPQAFIAEGDFTNQSPYTLNKVRLIFLLYNFSDKIIGISQRDEFTVAPFERRSYKQIWPGIFSNDVKFAKVFAETNTLDSSNLTLQSLPSSSASDLNRPKNQNSY